MGRLSFARLDRIYTNMSTQDILDHCPRAGTSWPIQDLKAPSDHCPVFLAFSPWTPTGTLRIPTWIARHPHFEHILNLVLDPEALSEDLECKLEEIKEAMRYSAQQVRHLISDRGAKTDEEKVACMLL
eukprot:5509192-Pyramimonas_sp.AAC.1